MKLLLEVDDIGLFGALGIEEDDATVVEVEGDGGARVGKECVPCGALLSNAFDGDCCRQMLCWQGGDVGGRCEYELRMLVVVRFMADDCASASSPQVVAIAQQVEDDGGLQVVGQTEIETAKAPPLPGVALADGLVGIVWPMLIDHISHEAIVGGRLYAESPTVADAP